MLAHQILKGLLPNRAQKMTVQLDLGEAQEEIFMPRRDYPPGQRGWDIADRAGHVCLVATVYR